MAIVPALIAPIVPATVTPVVASVIPTTIPAIVATRRWLGMRRGMLMRLLTLLRRSLGDAALMRPALTVLLAIPVSAPATATATTASAATFAALLVNTTLGYRLARPTFHGTADHCLRTGFIVVRFEISVAVVLNVDRFNRRRADLARRRPAPRLIEPADRREVIRPLVLDGVHRAIECFVRFGRMVQRNRLRQRRLNHWRHFNRGSFRHG